MNSITEIATYRAAIAAGNKDTLFSRTFKVRETKGALFLGRATASRIEVWRPVVQNVLCRCPT